MNEKALIDALGDMMTLVPTTIREDNNPKGMDITMYHTGSHEGDAKVIRQYANALKLLIEGRRIHG